MFYKLFGKRFFDLLIVLSVAVFLSWIFLLIILAFALGAQFPIFFKQKRIGKNNIPFWMWKFRTLSVNAELPLPQRNFALGKFMRFTNLDEFPQLWNIFIGEMSFIGPRPLPVEYLPLYSSQQRQRHNVRPGITGWAQVNGRNLISWQKKFELDIYYTDHLSFKFDFVILLKTVALLFSFRKDVSLEEEKFRGN